MFSKFMNMLFWIALSVCGVIAIGCGVALLLDWTELRHFESIDAIRGYFHFFIQYGVNLMVGILWLKFRSDTDADE